MSLFDRSPIYFQPLERELAPVARYLRGHLLNAGCGTRDISLFLQRNGVTNMTRYDLDGHDDGVIVGQLESMPFDDASFDSVLCNAVLEHVEDAERAMHEIARVMRKGAHAVVAVPFLQPYHASPGDYRRYTADGLAQLGRNAGLEVVEVLPVHSIAQTIAWIVWEYAREKGGFVRQMLAAAFAYGITRLFRRTDRKLVKNANTFQAVFRRGESAEIEVVGPEWRKWQLPAASRYVPTMLIPDELRLLNYLAERYYRGEGTIVDAGCFLGGSTVAFADGLRRNPRRLNYRSDKIIHSFDRFQIEDYTRRTFFPASSPTESSFRSDFDGNIAQYADIIEVHDGDICTQPWSGEPIEILFIDVAKHWTICDYVTREFFPHLIPGRSLVIQQDYLYHHWVAWLHITMEFYADYFEYVCDTGVNSVVFLYKKKIPEPLLRANTVESLSIEEKSELMDRAANRFRGVQRDLLISAKRHFLELLHAR